MNWQEAELMGYAYYAAKGYRIFVPLVCSAGYDFVAEKDGTFLKVNVKLAGLKDRKSPNSWSISQASGYLPNSSRRDKVPCDVFLVYMPHLSRFIELPGTFLDTGNSKSKTVPKSAFLS